MRMVSKTPGSYDTYDMSELVNISTEGNPRQFKLVDYSCPSLGFSYQGTVEGGGDLFEPFRMFRIALSPPHVASWHAHGEPGVQEGKWSGTEMGAKFGTYRFLAVQRSMRSSKGLCDLPLRPLHDLTHRKSIQHAHVRGRPSAEGLHMRPH